MIPARVRYWVTVLLAGIAVAAVPRPAAAASTRAGAAVLQIPVSVRSEGMGRAYAPLERNAFAAWANPGGLGFVRGVSVVSSRMQLVPDLASGVTLDYEGVVMGVGHIQWPLTMSLGFNHTGLDYGQSIYTDPGSPDPIGTFESHEFVHGVTFAAGYRDIVGVGVGLKRVEVDLAPIAFGAVPGRANAFDYGVLVRSPQVPIRRSGDAEPPWGVVLTGGLSWHNRGKDTIDLLPGRSGDPLPRVRREAVGIDLYFLPAHELFQSSSPWLSRLLRDVHLVSISAALGREKDLLAPYSDYADTILTQLPKNVREGITNHRGIELRFLDTIAVRFGRVNDEAGAVTDNTYGWGLSLLGKVGVDYARIPQFRELENVVKWSFWLRVPFDEAT